MDFEYIYLEEIDSTNKFAYDLGKQCKRNLVIVSKIQTSGKGRMDRTWISKEGGLYFSILMDISRVNPIEKINFLASVSVLETLKYFSNENFQIKWPNDILCNDKKICGILTELNVLKGYFVLGIGLNINNKIESSIKNVGTSLYCLEKENFDIKQIFEEFIKNFKVNLYMDNNAILEKYKTYSKTINSNVNLILPNKTVFGRVVEIDFNGIYLLNEKEISIYDVGDCIHLR
ncbi:biotin--acetyl-CoA-carboxylase ligase [Methanococcus vannielii SB]|uniref:Biotin--acetyl-CoA-carboxylase ligase n=1 Tax=Methanococcus vannielii (strain ATCC 35089 / DSM 1224 / JCM 13029 / OCM 148 / SB) TaxID=406327 RepID=A6URA2_METVS|nr:biotin--[acetyl-CoA-carboxylase] ligase [Methanococcus vannielii]ABR55024.1 biotin--acetyl-CoA-carboxylase ligase [Methanococcus vannielii SB]